MISAAVSTSEGSHCYNASGKQDSNDHPSNNKNDVLYDDTDVAAESQVSTLLGTGIVTSIVVIRCLYTYGDACMVAREGEKNQ